MCVCVWYYARPRGCERILMLGGYVLHFSPLGVGDVCAVFYAAVVSGGLTSCGSLLCFVLRQLNMLAVSPLPFIAREADLGRPVVVFRFCFAYLLHLIYFSVGGGSLVDPICHFLLENHMHCHYRDVRCLV